MKPNRTLVIAEAGVNHNGSLERARRLIEVAAESGADIVKFQTYRSASLVTAAAKKAEYQVANTSDSGSQLSMLQALELSEDGHWELLAHCRAVGIEFLSTPFDEESLGFLVEKIGVDRIKLSSGDVTNAPLLLAAARSGKPIILSTGMATLGEVEAALGVLAFGYLAVDGKPSAASFHQAYISDTGQAALSDRVTLLHCTTEYPAAFNQVNLRAMDTLGAAFGLPVGLSDHTPGISVSLAAVARGAQVIEKHFTLDRTLPGPDHKASLEPDELHNLVRGVREIELALGRSTKRPATSELNNLRAARRGLVAACAVRRGEPFTSENLTVKRGGGASPMDYWDWLGRLAERDYKPDEAVGAWVSR